MRLLFIGAAFLLSRGVYAQRIDSVLGAYSEHFPQEKVYLHFDRSVYNQGETIWFKAYLLAGFDPSTLSRNLYIDWFDARGRLLKHTVTPIYEASAKGQFDVPSGYRDGSVHVRAYTRWMLNFDTAFLYDKDIPIAQAAGHDNRQAPSGNKIAFFPEGGDLVNGLVSKVAFKANDPRGIPVTVTGIIRGSDGNVVDSLTTEHDGMGTFFIQPTAGLTYSADWSDGSGKMFHTPLPIAATSGVTLQVQPRADRSVVVVRRTVPPGSFNLVVHMNQHLVYEAQLRLDGKTEVALDVPTATLPTGILQFTLFDEAWKPLAERVVFVNNGLHWFASTVTVLTRSQEKRGKNEITLDVPDSVFSNMSVSVTDGDLPSGDDDIVSRLLLCDDIRGPVYHPAYYFSGDHARELDLVLLTHGWRRFKWGEGTPVIRYDRDTNYLDIRGKVAGNLPADQKVMLILEAKDSSRKSLLLPLSPDGTFSLKGLSFYDTVKVYYDFPGRPKQSAELSGGLLPPAFGSIAPAGVFTAGDTSRIDYFAGLESDRRKHTIELESITINGRRKRPVDALDERYATGIFKRDAGYQFDVKDDILARHSVDIFFYLKQVVPGLDVRYKDAYPILTWRQATPTLFVDEVATRADLVADIPITDIAYVKVFHPPFLLGGAANPRAGAIAIYTRKDGDVTRAPLKGLKYTLLGGYEVEREFYEPDASAFLPDVRPTLYWNPYVLLDAGTHSARLEFYNNDVTQKLRIVVEGMNADGRLTRIEKVIP